MRTKCTPPTHCWISRLRCLHSICTWLCMERSLKVKRDCILSGDLPIQGEMRVFEPLNLSYQHSYEPINRSRQTL